MLAHSLCSFPRRSVPRHERVLGAMAGCRVLLSPARESAATPIIDSSANASQTDVSERQRLLLSQRQRLLIVDDNPSIHMDFREILQPSNAPDDDLDAIAATLFGNDSNSKRRSDPWDIDLEIESAYQGEEALSMVTAAQNQNKPYFMAFVDVRMPPGIDGIQTIKALWRQHPEFHVVVCTAFTDYSWRQLITELGPAPNLLILRKPFDSIEVRQLVTSTIVRQQQHAAMQRELKQRQLDYQKASLAATLCDKTAQVVYDLVCDGILILDADGTIQCINAAAHTILSRLPTHAGTDVLSAAQEAVYEAVQRYIAAGDDADHTAAQIIELSGMKSHSQRLALHLRALDVPDERARRFVCVFREAPARDR